jgi:hypothetical protein
MPRRVNLTENERRFQASLALLPLAEQVKRLRRRELRQLSKIRKNLVPDAVIPVDTLAEMMPLLRNFRGVPNFRMVLLNEGRFVGQYNLRGDRGNAFDNQFFEGGSGEEQFIPFAEDADQILIFLPENIPAKPFNQIYRISENNQCVFDAITRRINFLLETSDFSKETVRKYNLKLKQVDKLRTEYPNGVPQSELANIATMLKVYIEVSDVLHNNAVTYGHPTKYLKVKLTNTRVDHLDLYTDRTPISIPIEDIQQKYVDSKENGSHYLIRNSTEDPTNIETEEGLYIAENDDTERASYMNAQIRGCAVDAIKYPELNSFLKDSRNLVSFAFVFEPFTKNTKLQDMKNAFVQHSACPFYEGFLGVVHQWRPITYMPKVGIYQVRVKTTTPFATKFNIHPNNLHIFASPYIKFWQSRGVTFDILCGAFGTKIDLHYTDDIIKTKYYNKWVGKLSQNDNYRETAFTLPGDREMASLLKNHYENTLYYGNTNEVVVRIPKTSLMNEHHIYAFIQAYSSINLLIQAEKYKSLKAVLCDGIYTDDDLIPSPLFHEAPKQIYLNNKTASFPENYFAYTSSWHEPAKEYTAPAPNTPSLILENTYLSGAGGTGKTHSVLTDQGFINILYVTLTNELCNAKADEYGVRSRTIHKMIGEGCASYKEKHPDPSVVIIDELTMINKKFIERFLEMYPNTLILLAGDCDRTKHYQCRSGGRVPQDIFLPTPDMPVVEYTTDYRSKTPKLKSMKQDLRKVMDYVYTNGGIEDTREIRDYLKMEYKFITFDQMKKQFTKNDLALWSTHRTKDLIYPFLETNFPEGITASAKPAGITLEHQQSKGVHAFQGKTVALPSKLYIFQDWFEYAMPYTAMSRATHHEQIVFVKT